MSRAPLILFIKVAQLDSEPLKSQWVLLIYIKALQSSGIFYSALVKKPQTNWVDLMNSRHVLVSYQVPIFFKQA